VAVREPAPVAVSDALVIFTDAIPEELVKPALPSGKTTFVSSADTSISWLGIAKPPGSLSVTLSTVYPEELIDVVPTPDESTNPPLSVGSELAVGAGPVTGVPGFPPPPPQAAKVNVSQNTAKYLMNFIRLFS